MFASTITMTERIPILQIRHAEGDDWSVAATWPDGRSEEIKGFKSESAANEWIANRFAAWLAETEDRAAAGTAN
jgi:hypothetical protein